jgi:aminopeptidase N
MLENKLVHYDFPKMMQTWAKQIGYPTLYISILNKTYISIRQQSFYQKFNNTGSK